LDWAPRAWACCWGQFVAISENNALFALIGTTYGGDGRTNFQLPDFRGRVPVCYGDGLGLMSYRLGERAGFEGIKLLQGQLPAHKHTAALSSVGVKFMASTEPGTQTTPGVDNATTLGSTVGRPSDKLYNSKTATVELSGVSTNGGTVSVQDTGLNQYHENRQPYLVTNYIMCMQGIFPPRQ
jgi:microcystin-dependent protein